MESCRTTEDMRGGRGRVGRGGQGTVLIWLTVIFLMLCHRDRDYGLKELRPLERVSGFPEKSS